MLPADQLSYIEPNMAENRFTPVSTICVVGLRGIPDVMGGIETHCEELYPRLKAELGDGVRLVILARTSYVPHSGAFAGVDIRPVYAPRNKYFETIVHTALALAVARFRFSARIVHIHAVGPALLAPLARLLGMKVIVTHHGEDFNRAKWNAFAKWMLRSGEKMAVRWSQRLIVISHALKGRIESHYQTNPDQVVYVPNGATFADSETSGMSVLNTFRLQPQGYILGVGRLVPEKGFQDLVEAYNAARDSGHVSQKLVIVGDADHQDRFARNLTDMASESLVFTGRISRANVLALLRNTSLFVLPSYHEGLPFVGLEAIASDAPIVLSNIPGNRELGLPQANYFQPGNIAAITKKLKAEHAQFRGDRAILSRYDWAQIASNTASLYRSLLAAK